MDEKCKSCRLICKQLDPSDGPVRYSFSKLSPDQVIATVESSIERYSKWHHLIVERCARSAGDQIVFVLRVSYMPKCEDGELILIGQSECQPDGTTDLWFRYGVPSECCQHPSIIGFNTMLAEVLETLTQCDWVLSRSEQWT